MDVKILRQQLPQSAPVDPNALDGRTIIQGLAGLEIEELESPGISACRCILVDKSLGELLDQMPREQLSQSRQGPVQRQAPSTTPSMKSGVAIEDAKLNALSLEMLGQH